MHVTGSTAHFRHIPECCSTRSLAMPSLPDEAGVAEQRFSTDAVPAEKRLAFWRNIFEQQAVRADIQPRSSDQFNAQGFAQAVPGLRITSFVSTPVRLQRTSQMAGDGDDALALLTPLEGRLSVVQRGRDVTLRPGEAVLVLHGEACTVAHDDIRFEGLVVPRAPVAAALRDVEDSSMRLIPANTGALQLLLRYVSGISAGLASDGNAARNVVGSHVQDLIAIVGGLGRSGAPVTDRGGMRAARLDAIKGYVISRIGHEEVTISDVSARHRITPRTLQRLFEEHGSTFSAFKLEQQLAYARRLLATDKEASRTIADIAYAAGFSDLSYFHRSFRRRFGMTPSDFRSGAVAA
jgi:AraC-like DNA-binding protein